MIPAKCQIVIKGSGVNIYCYRDGHPGAENEENGILSVVAPFLKEFKDKRGWDPSYLTARLVQRLCNLHSPYDFINYGIEPGEEEFHADIQYIYFVLPWGKDWELNVYETNTSNGDITISNSQLIQTIIL